MTPENFAYWLQGFVELHGAPPSAEQWEQIKAHLDLVFDKKTSIPISPLQIGGMKDWHWASDRWALQNIQC